MTAKSNYEDWSLQELQELVLHLGSLKAFAVYGRFTNDKLAELRNQGLRSPTQFVRDLQDEFIFRQIALKGSVELAAKYWGVSSSFLKQEVASRSKKFEECPISSDLGAGVEITEELVKKFGTVSLLARMLNLPQSVVRSKLKSQDLMKYLSFERMGNSTGSGRRAELFFIEKEQAKANCVVEDMVKVIGPSAPYDVFHSVHQRVNVKSSLPYKWTAKSRKNKIYYKMNMRGSDNCDNMALVIMDKDGNPMDYCIVASSVMKFFGTETVILRVEETEGGRKWILGSPSESRSGLERVL